MFIDRAEIKIKSGKGGDGAVSFRREPFVPDGGPDGGDGGKGGDVIFRARGGVRTLLDFKYNKKYSAENGENGMRRKRYGKKGKDLYIDVPQGTMIIDKESGLAMCDLVGDGDEFVAALGGKGGKGNFHFKNSVRQAPQFAEAGGAAQSKQIILELKLIADVGLVGYPNAGKSTLLSIATKAQPKIGDYHFTTLSPNLGVAHVGSSSFVMADIPGLIEGAHKGVGLGLDFLKHIDRTRILIHVVDVAGSEGRDPVEDFDNINNELSLYSSELAKKHQIVAGNKSDLIPHDDERIMRLKERAEALGYSFVLISAATNSGVQELLNRAAADLASIEAPAIETQEFVKVRPTEEEPDYRKVDVSLQNGVYVLEGKQLLKIFNSTNFNDSGSLRYLNKYIDKSGAVKRMKEMGLEEGDTVRISNYEFEYYDED